MPMQELEGNPAIHRAISREIRGGAPFHAHVIAGEPGTGRKTAALLFAAALVCDAPEDGPCGVCSSCRKTGLGIHPDVVTLSPTGKRDYKTEQIRALRGDAHVLPNEASRKVYILSEGDALNTTSQNAMLKLLEEPPSFAHFIIVTKSAENLLATVRSRCIIWYTRPVGRAAVIRALKTQYPEASADTVERAADACGGRIGAALELMRDTAAAGMHELAARYAGCLARRDETGALLCLSGMRYDREQYLVFCGALSDRLCAAAHTRAAGIPPERPEERELSERIATAHLLELTAVCRRHMDRQAQYAAVDISAAAMTAEIFAILS